MTGRKQSRHSDDRRAAELEWIAKNRPYLWEHHAGQWIAVQGSDLVAVAESASEVLRLAREKGIKDPLVTAVREKAYQGMPLIR